MKNTSPIILTPDTSFVIDQLLTQENELICSQADPKQVIASAIDATPSENFLSYPFLGLWCIQHSLKGKLSSQQLSTMFSQKNPPLMAQNSQGRSMVIMALSATDASICDTMLDYCAQHPDFFKALTLKDKHGHCAYAFLEWAQSKQPENRAFWKKRSDRLDQALIEHFKRFGAFDPDIAAQGFLNFFMKVLPMRLFSPWIASKPAVLGRVDYSTAGFDSQGLSILMAAIISTFPPEYFQILATYCFDHRDYPTLIKQVDANGKDIHEVVDLFVSQVIEPNPNLTDASIKCKLELLKCSVDYSINDYLKGQQRLDLMAWLEDEENKSFICPITQNLVRHAILLQSDHQNPDKNVVFISYDQLALTNYVEEKISAKNQAIEASKTKFLQEIQKQLTDKPNETIGNLVQEFGLTENYNMFMKSKVSDKQVFTITIQKPLLSLNIEDPCRISTITSTLTHEHTIILTKKTDGNELEYRYIAEENLTGKYRYKFLSTDNTHQALHRTYADFYQQQALSSKPVVAGFSLFKTDHNQAPRVKLSLDVWPRPRLSA